MRLKGPATVGDRCGQLVRGRTPGLPCPRRGWGPSRCQRRAGDDVVLEGGRLAVATDGTDGPEEVAVAVVDVAQGGRGGRGARAGNPRRPAGRDQVRPRDRRAVGRPRHGVRRPAAAVVPRSPKMVGLRFQAAARAAGVERVSAHSERVGLASELTSRGASTTDVCSPGTGRRAGWLRTTPPGLPLNRCPVAPRPPPRPSRRSSPRTRSGLSPAWPGRGPRCRGRRRGALALRPERVWRRREIAAGSSAPASTTRAKRRPSAAGQGPGESGSAGPAGRRDTGP